MAMQTREKVRRLPTRQKIRPPLRKGVYLLPNLFTTGGLFCGFYASVTTLQGEFRVAATAILIALIFDSLDGRIARMTKTSSRFGAEYDSLSDLVAFGVAPVCWPIAGHWSRGAHGGGWRQRYMWCVAPSAWPALTSRVEWRIRRVLSVCRSRLRRPSSRRRFGCMTTWVVKGRQASTSPSSCWCMFWLV